jgi:hypothetical protein
MPSGDVFDGVRQGRFVLGGCVITGDDPEQQCLECGANVFPDGRFERPEW